MNILGIDYGQKRIGLAWVQTGLGVVLPFGQIQNQESDNENRELVELIKKERIDLIVIGLPLGTDGMENKNTQTVRAFADVLKQKTGLSPEFMDERFTSQFADAVGGDATRDEKSAMAILQSYMDSK